jgi:hypothetical protein
VRMASDGTGSGSYPMTGFVVRRSELSGSANIVWPELDNVGPLHRVATARF